MASASHRVSSFRFILCVYVVAIAAAGIAWALWDVASPADAAWGLLAGYAAATVVTMIATLRVDNGSVFDAWWSVLPPFAAIWCTTLAVGDGVTPRQVAVHAVVWFWALRLTANWAAGWPGLDHEDWRYVRLKERWPVPKWAVYLVAVEGAPTLFVWLGSLSLYPALALGGDGFGVLDGVALSVGLGAVALELAADEQMRSFAATKRPGDIMQGGLWRYSRHPNYLGEIGFWVSLWLFAVAAAPGVWWVVAGPLAMVGLFVFASIPLLDERSIERRPGYAEYAARVPALVPRPRRSQAPPD
jgi:steroid 5-alpha reductase family enzyme